MSIERGVASLASVCALVCATSWAQSDETEHGSRLDAVQVTATRFHDQVQEVPDVMSIVTGDDLRARGARDLRTALSVIAGVNVALGGDQGPAAAVPGLLGLREVDDFLLLIDGIPAGSAFLPSFEIVSLHNVERIEVLRGQAPVYYGTTAFAGTINIVHYRAGEATREARLDVGSRGADGVAAATVLSDGPIAQSISAEWSREPSADPRADAKRAQAAYRLALPMGDGRVALDANVLRLRQKPGSPSPVDASGQLTTALAPGFNQNPSDARLDTDRVQMALNVEQPTAFGDVGATLSLNQSRVRSVRGFLLPDALDPTATPDGTPNAEGAVQARRLTEAFIDAHVTHRFGPAVIATVGINELAGRATQSSRTFAYLVPLDGTLPADSASATLDEAIALRDTRSFFGAYTQARWSVTDDAHLLAGVRWNATRETRTVADADDTRADARTTTRWSGTLGGEVRVWHDTSGDLDDVTLHASIGNTFQPAQIDFGPDAGAQPLLAPETQRSLSAGVKADGLDGRFDVDLAAFYVNFDNRPVTSQIDGTPTLVNGGKQRFRGIELETSLRPVRAMTVAAHASLNDARYRDFTTLIDGTPTQLAGNRLALTPRWLAGASVAYAPTFGWRASITANRIGERYLDERNTARAAGYWIADATLGFGFARVLATLSVTNLGNRRDPTIASELGDGQIYRVPARRVTFGLAIPLS